MRKNYIYFIVLVILASLAFYLLKNEDGGKMNSEILTDYAIEDTSLVQRIFIANNLNNEKIDLKRIGDGSWSVNDQWIAKKDRIDILLKTFDRAEVIYPVPKTELASVIKLMASNNKKVMIYGYDNKLLKTWYLSHATQSQQGTYALLEIPGKGKSAEPSIISLSGFRGFVTSRFHTDILEWRSANVFSFPELDIKEIEVFRPEELHNTFKITVKDFLKNDFALEDNDGNFLPFNSHVMASYISGYKNINLESFQHNLEQYQVDSLKALQPDIQITVWDKNDDQKTVKLYYLPVSENHKSAGYDHDPERMAGIVEDEVVTFQRLTVDKLMAIPQNFK